MAKTTYDKIGRGYATQRRTDPRIARLIEAALSNAHSIVNVGAGAGSYEPDDRLLVAVEPSIEMTRQRQPTAAPCVQAFAEALPFASNSFAAGMAILTIHHWRDWRAGLRELQRVAPDRVVIMTWDPSAPGFWLTEEYFPEFLAVDREIFPRFDDIAQILGPMQIEPVQIPFDCADGFLGAYWQRPNAYLDPSVRRAISSFARVGRPHQGLARLRRDLGNGQWKKRSKHLLDAQAIDLGYRLLISTPGVRRAS